ncbi:12753_t:CDS:2, partial [Entrophospora sp. SA101]
GQEHYYLGTLVHDFLPVAYGLPLYKEIKRNYGTYITIVSEDTEIKNFDEYIYSNIETLKEAYAAISICHKRLPNEHELCEAIP